MMNDELLRQELVNLLIKKQAHADFKDAVEGFAESHINIVPKGCNYSFWHLVEHMRICQKDILDYIVLDNTVLDNTASDSYVWPNFPDDLWPSKDASTDVEGWQQSVNSFLADREALVQIVQNPATDLFAPLENSKEHQHSILREIHVIAAHNAYHAGGLVIMRQRADIWV